MIKDSIEKVIRDFAAHEWGEQVALDFEWPGTLAELVAQKVTEEIAEAINKAWFSDPL